VDFNVKGQVCFFPHGFHLSRFLCSSRHGEEVADIDSSTRGSTGAGHGPFFFPSFSRRLIDEIGETGFSAGEVLRF